MDDLPYEIQLQILKNIDSIDLLKSICSSSKSFRRICKENWKTLVDKLDEKYSVVILRNYNIWSAKSFKSDHDAIKQFKSEVKQNIHDLHKYNVEYDIKKDVAASLIKLTIDDYSDKIYSYLLCGFSLSQNKKLIKEIDSIIQNITS